MAFDGFCGFANLCNCNVDNVSVTLLPVQSESTTHINIGGGKLSSTCACFTWWRCHWTGKFFKCFGFLFYRRLWHTRTAKWKMVLDYVSIDLPSSESKCAHLKSSFGFFLFAIAAVLEVVAVDRPALLLTGTSTLEWLESESSSVIMLVADNFLFRIALPLDFGSRTIVWSLTGCALAAASPTWNVAFGFAGVSADCTFFGIT